MVYRHSVIVRVAHWVNAVAIFLLIGSGLNIFNAHPRLYWGRDGTYGDPALFSVGAAPGGPGGMHGVTQLGPYHLVTTGVLGWSHSGGQWLNRAWPAWLTIPGDQDLADARHWHFLLGWILVANGLLYLLWSFGTRHIQRDLWPSFADLRAIPRSVWDHLRLRHPTGEASRRYNVLQKLAYLGLIVLVGGMVATGLTMSPGVDAFAPGLLDLFGGRQSARTLHFACATLITLFIVVHLSQVVLAGPINEVRSIVTGRFRLRREHR